MKPSELKAPSDFVHLAQLALGEVEGVFTKLPQDLSESFVREVGAAQRIALYGVGREGLVMRSLAMRLYHAGKSAFMVGDMAAQPLEGGDLLIVSAGPGGFSTVNALLGVAGEAGSRRMLFTAESGGAAAQLADVTLLVPAQTMHADTMHSDGAGAASILPMGSLYELSLWLLCDLLIEDLKKAEGISSAQMRQRHTNLE